MTAVIRLETVVHLGSSRRPAHLVDGEHEREFVPSDRAQPGPAPVSEFDEERDPHQVSVSATLSVVLESGERVTLLDDRGWASSARWDETTMAEIEDTARTVVGPDEPIEGQTYEEAAADYWSYLVDLLGQQGITAHGDVLRSLPHDVVPSAELRARLNGS
ncbi:MAG TPA: hypothetical protein VI076_16260 [Actinopolymorphaceae bacterium]